MDGWVRAVRDKTQRNISFVGTGRLSVVSRLGSTHRARRSRSRSRSRNGVRSRALHETASRRPVVPSTCAVRSSASLQRWRRACDGRSITHTYKKNRRFVNLKTGGRVRFKPGSAESAVLVDPYGRFLVCEPSSSFFLPVGASPHLGFVPSCFLEHPRATRVGSFVRSFDA